MRLVGNDVLALLGANSGGIDFGAGPIAAGNYIATVFATDGSGQWSRGFVGSLSGTGCAVHPDRTLTFAGSFSGSLDFGTVPTLTSVGPSNVFVANVAP
jgi:hypothetical protein